jgi:fructokinase
LQRIYREVSGELVTATQIAERAQVGEGSAQAVMDRYEDRLARALASVVNVLDPDAIVFGGGLSRIARLYDTLPRLLRAYVFGDAVRARILPPRFGDASGVRGAAMLAGA